MQDGNDSGRDDTYVLVECLGTIVREEPRRHSAHVRRLASVRVDTVQTVDVLRIGVRGADELGEGVDDLRDGGFSG